MSENKKIVDWSFTVKSFAIVDKIDENWEIVEIFATDKNGKSVSLNLGAIDVHSEERAMAEEGVFGSEDDSE